jgi:hypothetical protein
MACQKVSHYPPKSQEDQKLLPSGDTCLYIDKDQSSVLDECAEAVQGIATALRTIDEASGLGNALKIVYDKMTEILGEVEGQSVSYFLGSAK